MISLTPDQRIKIGNALADWRKGKGLKQTAAASVLNTSKVTLGLYENYEKTKIRPPLLASFLLHMPHLRDLGLDITPDT